MKEVSKSSSLQAKWYKEDLWNMAMDKGDKEKANKILEATTIEEMDSIWYSNPKVDNFKKKKQNAKIKKVIGVILLILGTLAIIGAIFFLYKAFKSRHDAIKAEQDNPKYNDLKQDISKNNNTVHSLNEKLKTQQTSNEIAFNENGKDYKAIFDPDTQAYSIFEKNDEGIFGTEPVKTITSTSEGDMFVNLQTKLQEQKNSNILILDNGNKAEFNPETNQWSIYQKTTDGFDIIPSKSIMADNDNSTIFANLQKQLKDKQTSNEITFNENGKDYKAIFDPDTQAYSIFEKNDEGIFGTEPIKTITSTSEGDMFANLQTKLQEQHTSNEIIYTDADGNIYKAVFDDEKNTFNLFKESIFSTQSDTTLALTSLNGKEIPFTCDGKQMKYVYNEGKDCFDVFEAGKNGKFSKYPVDTIKYTPIEEISKLKYIDFPKYMIMGGPSLAVGGMLASGGVGMLMADDRERQNSEEREQLSKLNILSKTPATNYYINPQQYNAQPQNINNATIEQYNTAGVNQYNTGNTRGY